MEIVVMIKFLEILGMFLRRRVLGADSVLVDSGNDDLFMVTQLEYRLIHRLMIAKMIFNVAQELIQPILMSLCTEAPQRMIAR